MCSVSFISDYYWKKWPYDPVKYPWENPSPYIITKEQWEEYQELKRRAEKYDRETNQPDCIKPEIKEWEAQLEEFLKKKGVIK